MFRHVRFPVSIAVLVATVALLGSTASSVHASTESAQYSITNLGTLGGSLCAGFSGQNSFGTAINNSGQAAGGSCKFVGFFQPIISAFFWSNGVITDIGISGAAYAVNDAGDVVGGSGNPDFEASGTAFVWRGGSLTSLGPVLGGFSRAFDINNLGQVVGLRGTPPAIDRWRSFLYDLRDGSVIDLGTLGGTFRSTATAINDAGQVAGWASLPDENTFHAFLWSNGAMTDLGTLGGTHSFAHGLNASGQVVGHSWVPTGGEHAFLWSGGRMTDLGTLGGSFSVAWAIDDRGRVVGSAGTPASGPHAFVWTNRAMRDLNDLIPAGSGWVLREARGINNNGQIVGTGRFGSEERAFLLTPTSSDVVPPTLTVPEDITAEATGPTGAVVSYAASALDDVDGPVPVSCAPPSGSTFPLGTTTVQCTTTDAAGNSASASFQVTAVDSTPPVLTVPDDITANATSPAGAEVVFGATATDIADGAFAASCTPPSGSTFPIGTTTVTCTATDAHGNSASASFTVHVKGAVEQLADLGKDVIGVGPGTSLADKVKQARSSLAGSNLSDTCSALAAFVNEVSAQSGRTIPAGQATALILRGQRIRLVLGGPCVSANLIVNGGAEAAAGSDGTSVVPVPGWTTSGNFTVVDYVLGEPGGWPGPNAPGPPNRGANFFSGGPDNLSSSASQTIGLTAYAGQIDRGAVAYSLNGWLGGFDGQDDNATLGVSFRDKNGGSLGTSTIGPVLADDRGNERGFAYRDATGLIPIGTRSVVVQLVMTRTDGVFNDGYADNLSLVITR